MSARWDSPPSPTRRAASSREAPGLDPYLRWAEHTDWRGMKGQAGWDRDPSDDDRLQIIARADDPSALARLTGSEFADLLDIAPTYRGPVPGCDRAALHFTAWVRRSDLERLRRTRLPAVWEISQPRRDAERTARGSAMGKFGPLRNAIEFAADNLLGDCIARAEVGAPVDRLDHVIAVIDFGCPFLNTRFTVAPGVAATRIARLWDQGSPARRKDAARTGPRWPWSEPAALGYGREIHPNRLQAMVQCVHAAPVAGRPALDEAAAYRGIDHLIDHDDPRRRIFHATHGSHVLDVAGGTLDPLTGRPDAASEAALVFVQLPSMTAADSSGASLASHLLDAVRYVLEQCSPAARVVVNISYGSYAGPHDGRSLIEGALDELLRLRGDDFAIVLAAGNARQRSCHARRELRPERSALLRVDLAEGDTTDTFVEAWYPRPLPPGWTLKARVRGPGREWSEPLPPDQEQLQRDTAAGNEVVAMLRHEALPPNGAASSGQERMALVLLALAPTAAPAGVPCALSEAGRWEIELLLERTPGAAQGDEPPGVEINAWIERDDAGQAEGTLAHRFVDQDGDDDLNTLSSLASGESTVLAGGFRRSDRRPASYSAFGPQRGRRSPVPMMLAACEDDDAQPDIAAAAVRSGETWRMNGTSVAAPVLARRLFNLLAERASQGRSVGRADWTTILPALAELDDCLLLAPERPV